MKDLVGRIISEKKLLIQRNFVFHNNKNIFVIDTFIGNLVRINSMAETSLLSEVLVTTHK